MKIRGLTHDQLDQRLEVLDGLVQDALRITLRVGAQALGRTVTAAGESSDAAGPDDLAIVRTAWEEQVANELLPFVAAIYNEGAMTAQIGIEDALKALGRAASVPVVRSEQAESALAEAGNRLRGVGDEVWEHARAELLEGQRRGESITELAARVHSSAGLAEPRARVVARTEVIGAANAGAHDEMLSLGLTATKEWLATEDSRTRLDHREVDGEQRPLREAFTVGGWSMQRPHDPTAPPDQTINCRCTLLYDIAEDALEDEGALTAAAGVVNGAMIALVPSEADLDRLVLDDSYAEGIREQRDELHLTLAYLGLAENWSPAQREGFISVLRDTLEDKPTAQGRIFGAAFWNADGLEPSWVLNVSGQDLVDVKGFVWETIYEAESEELLPEIAEQYAPWSPHICLAYMGSDKPDRDEHRMIDELALRSGMDVTFDRVRIAFAGETTDIPLQELEKPATE